jgi:flagellar basal body-associated protein FliL
LGNGPNGYLCTVHNGRGSMSLLWILLIVLLVLLVFGGIGYGRRA